MCALTLHLPTELQMRHNDGRPADDSGADCDRDEIEERVARKEVVQEHDDERDA